MLSITEKGYLDEIGWFNAFKNKSPVGQNGEPIPWVTYSFIDFITARLNKSISVFEFGSGNSTFFYAEHAAKVVSVEHDKDWYDKVVNKQPENAKMIFCELVRGGDYCQMPITLKEKFDIIIVDGRDRVNCCLQSVNALSPGGVVVLDDSERDFYSEGIDFLKSQGFKQLSFSGISPGLFYNKATSVFYKANNCLNI
jgi:SAM-dependent methyltransferase